jgi:predicted RNase H-like HicB family nuclease
VFEGKGEMMQELQFTYYKGEHYFVGWMEDYPDYWTQGETLEELVENLRDIQVEMCQGGSTI